MATESAAEREARLSAEGRRLVGEGKINHVPCGRRHPARGGQEYSRSARGGGEQGSGG